MRGIAGGDAALALADEIGKAVEQLEDELDAATASRPPSTDELSDWFMRADALVERLDDAEVPRTARIRRIVVGFLDRLQDVAAARARHIERRQAARIESPIADPAGLRAVLVGAIELALRAGDQGQSIEKFSETIPDADRVSEERALYELAELESEVVSLRHEGPQSLQPLPAEPALVELFELRTPPREAVPESPGLSTRTDPIIAIEGRLARADAFEEARRLALQWLRRKGFTAPDDLPREFELSVPRKGHRATAIAAEGVWALQVNTADAQQRGRHWCVEMVLVDASPTPAIAVTLTATSSADCEPPGPSVPGLLMAIMERIGVVDPESGEALVAGPVQVDSLAAMERLVRSLQSPRRQRPAFVLSQYRRKDGRFHTLLDPDGLARKVGGLARVHVLHNDLVWSFTEAMTRRFAVAGARVRHFRPGFDVDDDPSRHPVWGPDELRAESLSANGLCERFLREAAKESLKALQREDAVPAFERVREMVLRRQIEEARARVQTRDDDSGDVAALRSALADAEELANLYAREKDRLIAELASKGDELDRERARNRYLEGRLAVKPVSAETGESAPAFPESWDTLEEWCERHLGESVVLSSKAVRAARDSVYQDIAFAYRVLWYLGSIFVPCRLGHFGDGAERLARAESDLGIEISPPGKAAVERKSRETYSTTYDGERLSLDWHVKGNSSRDPRFGFRLYFNWQASRRRVVVGWLPSHLDNALT